MRAVVVACVALILASAAMGMFVEDQHAAVQQPPKVVGSADGSTHFNCEICDWVIGKLDKYVNGSTDCTFIDSKADEICSDVPFSPVGPALCKYLVGKACPKIITFLQNHDAPNVTCERIGLCSGAGSECHSFGKLQNNGQCTAILAEQSDYWRLEWNLLPWWKNKGCKPPRHIGDHKEWCSTENIGCCLSGYTPH